MSKRKLNLLIAVLENNEESKSSVPVFKLVQESGAASLENGYVIPYEFSKLIKKFKKLKLVPTHITVQGEQFHVRLKPGDKFDYDLVLSFMEVMPNIHKIYFRPIRKVNEFKIPYEYQLTFNFEIDYPETNGFLALHLFKPLNVYSFMSISLKKFDAAITEAIKNYKKTKKESKKESKKKKS
jgi:hypothetical protein